MKYYFDRDSTDAVGNISDYGYDDEERIREWIQTLRNSAISSVKTPEELDEDMERAMRAAFKKAFTKSALKRYHPGVSRATIDQIEPYLRDELDRRILAATELIKLNREQAIEKTLQRFSGWATSIPAGGSRTVDKRKVKQHIAKPLRSMKYEERRLYIDQGHKLLSSINDVISIQTGTIAKIWRSHWRRPGYDYRPDHKERDKKIYIVRGSWAMKQGLIKRGLKYTDQVTRPGEEPFCRCYYVNITSLRDMPEEMLTRKGKKVLEETRIG